jgi:hypothetical protein
MLPIPVIARVRWQGSPPFCLSFFWMEDTYKEGMDKRMKGTLLEEL